MQVAMTIHLGNYSRDGRPYNLLYIEGLIFDNFGINLF